MEVSLSDSPGVTAVTRFCESFRNYAVCAPACPSVQMPCFIPKEAHCTFPAVQPLFSKLKFSLFTASPASLGVKNPPTNAGDLRDAGSIPGVGKMPWRRKWQPTPVFLPGESHGQRSLAGYRPWGRKESDTTEAA